MDNERGDANMTAWKVGIVGVGGMGIANYHTQEIIRDGRAQITACCDIDQDALKAYAEKYQVPKTYTDFTEMLENEQFDVVLICTAELLHAPMTIQAASFTPKAILCEKPMAMNLGEAKEMLRVCRENDVLLLIGHQRRYKPQYARAKELLNEGVIGGLERIIAAGHAGTSLMVDGTHTVDLIRFFVSDAPVGWVFGQVDAHSARKGRWKHVLEDASLSIMKFENGVRAFMTTGGYAALGGEALGMPTNGVSDDADFHYHRILLVGEKGTIDIRGDKETGDGPLLSVRRGDVVEPVEADPGAWHQGRSPHSHLFDILERGGTQNDDPHLLQGDSAYADLEILLAIYESARLRRVVNLPLENMENPLEQMLAETGESFVETG